MKYLSVTLLICFILISVLGTGCASQDEGNVIKVGVVGPMAFVQGQHHWYGAEFARDEINAKGGITMAGQKYNLKPIKIDSNEILSITDAASAMERAITVDKVDFLVGGFRTEALVGMQDIAMQYKKIFIGCGSATAELCVRVKKDYDKYKYWFRGTPYNETYLVNSDFMMLIMVGAQMKKELGITGNLKVAIIAEKLVWADGIVGAAQKLLPTFGMDVVGVWRPSDTATDVKAELSAIQASGAHIIFTTFSGPVGITFAKQMGELQIPAASVGINVEGQKKGFWEATGGKGNYDMTLNTYARVKMTDTTIPFYDAFVKKVGEFPTYTAGTYDALLLMKDVIEKAGTLNSDTLVTQLEKTDYPSTAGRIVFMGRDTNFPHDLTYGKGYVTGVGTQWQDGKLECVWPIEEQQLPTWKGITYDGTKPYKLSPAVIAKYKK